MESDENLSRQEAFLKWHFEFLEGMRRLNETLDTIGRAVEELEFATEHHLEFESKLSTLLNLAGVDRPKKEGAV